MLHLRQQRINDIGQDGPSNPVHLSGGTTGGAHRLAQLFAALHRRLIHTGGRLTTPFGHDLAAPEYGGMEVGFMESPQEARTAIAEIHRRKLPFGIHYPLVPRHEWDWAPFWFDPDPDGRRRARAVAAEAARQAADLGAEYILIHYPWPSLLESETDYIASGWKIPPVAQPDHLWPRERLRLETHDLLAELEATARDSGIELILEFDGPNRHFFAPPAADDLVTEVFSAHPEISLCVDTGRFDLLARQHAGDPLEYTERWLAFARHVHLHGANWDRRENHLPPLPEHLTMPGHAPAAAMAERILAAHPQARVVLETNPALLSSEDDARSLSYCAELVRRADLPSA